MITEFTQDPQLTSARPKLHIAGRIGSRVKEVRCLHVGQQGRGLSKVPHHAGTPAALRHRCLHGVQVPHRCLDASDGVCSNAFPRVRTSCYKWMDRQLFFSFNCKKKKTL